MNIQSDVSPCELLKDRLKIELAEVLELDPAQIKVNQRFDRLGLDSLGAVNLTTKIEDWLKQEFSPTIVYEYPTVEKLGNHLHAEMSERQEGGSDER